MNKQKWILLVAAISLMAVTGGMLHHLKTHQRLGVPGIKATAIPGSTVLQIDLPEFVLDFTSTNVPQAENVTNMLPKDTSFASRHYQTSNDSWGVTANIVMMGKDRTSIHKPEYCLPGQGWRIESQTNVAISIAGPQPYELPVAKMTLSISAKDGGGRMQEYRCLYMFWFVADNEETTSHWQRMWWLARDLLRQGVLQRWAYVSYYAICAPGQEDATFERVQKLIAASVPEFQLPPRSATSNAVARQ
jgi:Protein of unknown function (DUF3485)